MKLYHYTKGYHIPEIIACGEIRPATLGVSKGERPIVWFSTNPVWENTVSSRFGKNETERLGEGLYRFVVDIEAYSWARLRFLSHMHPATADKLEEIALRVKADPNEWYGTFRPVFCEKWLAIEVWINNKWRKYENKSTNTTAD